MATTTKTKTTKVETEQVTETPVETVQPENESVKKAENVSKVKKEYAPTDGVPCKSITPGKLFMEGIKTHIVYRWSDCGDVVDVEYQDLVAAIRSSAGYVMKPFFVIEDEEFVSKYPQVHKIYEKLYTIKDLRSVLTDLRPAEMKKVITSLPLGAQDAIKHLASDMISKGTLDSVQKIKYLDEIFDTELMLMTGLFNG